MMSARIKNLVKIAILVAVLAVGSQISIPTPFLVPITLQILFVALVGFLLKTPSALATVLVYVSIGAVGLPVFASFNGGFGILFGYTGGFIFGFFPLVALCSLGKGKIRILFGILGTILCHVMGVLQYMLVAHTSFLTSLITTSLPYILKDIILVVIAYFVSVLISKRIKKES